MNSHLKKVKDYLIDFSQVINESQMIKIFKCTNQLTTEQLCVKIISKQQKQMNWAQEKQIFELIKQHEHQNVIKIYDLIEDNDNFYVFMETCENDINLFFQEKAQFLLIQDILSQIIAGYLHLRKLQIIVRDLTPETILYKQEYGRNIIKIASFALGKITPKGKTITSAGTPIYMAPEILYHKGKEYTDVCDVYSLGIILYRLCFKGSFPQNIIDQVQLHEFHNKLKITSFTCPPKENIHPEFIKLIENMIIYDPQKRFTWEQLDLAPKLQQKFIIWKNKYLIDLTAIYGQGAQGLILLAEDLQKKQTVLAKKVNTQSTSGEREKKIYQNLIGHKNQNVIKVLDICEPYKSQFCYLILEKGEFNLKKYFEYKNNFKKEEIIDFAQQIIDGYCFLKNQNIIHRDLKPENIVIVFDSNKKPIYKIIDFGTGKILTLSDMPQTKAGTPLFQAPEVLKGGSEYDNTCDIFSFGFMMYNIVFNRYPCKVRNEQELKIWHEQIKQNPLKCPIYEEPEISKLIEKMLLYDRIQRITWDELQNHPLIGTKRRQIHEENKTVIQEQQAQKVLQQQLFDQQPQQEQQKLIKQSQNSQNGQLKQQITSQKIKIVEVQYELFEDYGNLKIVHSQNQSVVATEQNNSNNLNQPQNIQNNTPPNEISLAEYIYQIIQLTRKFIDTVEDYLNKDQQFPYQYELTFLTVFALRFLISCFMTLDQIYENKTIQINGFSFKTDRTQVLNINSQEILKYIKEKNQKSKIKIGQISSDLQVKKQFLNLKQQMDLEAQQQTKTSGEIYFTHNYFKLYYLTFRNEVKQITEIPLLLKFLLEKLNNLFDDFPVRNPLLYKLRDIYYKIIQNQQMEIYLKKWGF